MKNSHIKVGLLFVGICLLAGLGIAYFTMPNPSAQADKIATSDTASSAGPVVEATKEASSDFLVTNQLRRDKPTWEDVGQGPNGISFCKGDAARLTNGSDKALNLKLVVSESDVSESLGSVAAGQTLKFDTGDVGTWDIVDAGDGGPLFQYEVTACPSRNGASPSPAAVTADLTGHKQGKCRLTVDGKRLIDGACFYSTHKGGSFDIADTSDDTGYAAVLKPNGDGTGYGTWNGRRGSSDVFVPFGPMARKGACWTEERNEICLWAS